jgi:hypothetical protein
LSYKIQEWVKIKKNLSDVFYVDIEEIYPSEAYTIYHDINKAEQYYLSQDTTQYLIKQIEEGNMLNPIEIVPFNGIGYEGFRNKKALEEYIPKYKYVIEDGNHRYFAYKYCGIKKIPVQINLDIKN